MLRVVALGQGQYTPHSGRIQCAGADGTVRLAGFVELGGADEAERDKSRTKVTRQLARFVRAHRDLLDLEHQIASTPKQYVNVRGRLIAKAPRLKITCSQELRRIAFHARALKQAKKL
jgi:hypothetical protein